MAYLKRLFPRKDRCNYNERLMPLVNQGLSLKEIGGRLNPPISRERVRQLIKRHELYDLWIASKKKYLESKPLSYDQIHNVLVKVRDKKFQELPWPEKKAIEYLEITGRPDKRTNYGVLKRIFSAYYEGMQSKRKVTLSELEEKANFGFVSMAQIFRKMGLKTLSRPRKNKKIMLDTKTKDLLSKCNKTEMPCSDVAYFIGLKNRPYHVSTKTHGLKPMAKKLTGKFFGEVSYTSSFEVYEAQNLGFRKYEISELLDLKIPSINYIFQHQRKIKEVIKNDLNLIYREKIPDRYQFLFKK